MLNVLSPKEPAFPLIVSVPHAGTNIPDDVVNSFASQDAAVLKRDVDLFVDELYDCVPVYGGTLVVTKISRYVIDLNRDAKDRDASFVKGGHEIPNPRNLGLIANKTTRDERLLKEPLTPEELERRIADYYKPFHDRLHDLIRETKRKAGFTIHIDAHSMPSRGTTAHTDAGRERADIVLGDRNGTSCAGSLTLMIHKHFEHAGLSVRQNDPYQGGFITASLGQPDANVHSIQIEINRKLYMDEESFAKKEPEFENLRSVIENLIYKVRRWRPA